MAASAHLLHPTPQGPQQGLSWGLARLVKGVKWTKGSTDANGPRSPQPVHGSWGDLLSLPSPSAKSTQLYPAAQMPGSWGSRGS